MGQHRTAAAAPAALAAIAALPDDWPLAGSLRPGVLARLAHHASQRRLVTSLETGVGKSTLLLSQLSHRHLAFTEDDAGRGDSLAGVRRSALLRPGVVEFSVGPTQATLPRHTFDAPLELALLDGPHAFPFPLLEYYYVYPHLSEDAVLVVDDIHVRAVNQLFVFLRSERMFELLEVVRTTAFFRRTSAPLFDPLGDGWWLQGYNRRVWPPLGGLSALGTLKALVPFGFRERWHARRRIG